MKCDVSSSVEIQAMFEKIYDEVRTNSRTIHYMMHLEAGQFEIKLYQLLSVCVVQCK